MTILLPRKSATLWFTFFLSGAIFLVFSLRLFLADWFSFHYSVAPAAGTIGCWAAFATLFASTLTLFMPNRTGRSLRESIFRAFATMFAGCFYRVRTHRADQLPPGGFLLLPNHMSYVDAVVLQLACPRPIRFVVHSSIFEIPWLKPIMKLVQAIPISSTHAKDALRLAADRIKQGEIVCIFPEGELSRTGILIKLRKGFELVARLADAPVVPVWLDGLWGSIFSFERGKYFFKWPKRIPQPVHIAFGAPIAPRGINIGMAREKLLELGEFCFERRPELQRHLGRVTIRGLKRHQFDEGIVDGMDGRRIKRGDLLAASLALSRWIKANCPGERVAVVLPPGAGAVVANVAITLADKVPVNLNFTSGRAALQSAINTSQIMHAISAKAVMKRLTDFPWPKHVCRLEEIIPELKPRIVFWRVLSLLLPAPVLASVIGLPVQGGLKEAVLLFTSGSSGEPKGVVLTHRSVLGNIAQFSPIINLSREHSVMASLPFFHSFGCTVTLWYPLTEGVKMVTYPTPVDVVKNAELVQKHGVTLLITTPTFLRGYLKRAEAAHFRSVKILITGAEKLPRELGDAFEERFGVHVYEGYGITETAPVVSTNLPDPAPSREGDTIQPASRVGSVGKLLPGQAAQIRHPETGEKLQPTDLGMLWLRGLNVFQSYLNEPEITAGVLRDGWFKTGDLGRFDEDGFLYIEGRLSRFSKIGGEMVPHETLEARINEAIQTKVDEERSIAVVGIPDDTKGESLMLLTARELSLPEVREKLLTAGIPSLWIPKKVKVVERIPVLGSGKLDLGKCRELATS